MAKKKVVTLSDATLLTLAKRPVARQRVPALNKIFNAITRRNGGRRGCGSCARRAKLSQSVIACRNVIAQQPASLQALKQILKADKLILYIRGPKGMTQRKEV